MEFVMYADPQTVTIQGVATTLPRTPSSNSSRLGEFTSADGNVTLSIRQDKTNNRFRREIRLTQRKVAADPISAVNKEVSASVIIVFDEPRFGFVDADLLGLYSALATLVSANTNAKLTQLLGGEL